MKLSVFILLTWSLLINNTLLAKFSGIPNRIESVDGRPKEIYKQVESEREFSLRTCTEITPSLIRSLMAAERIDEPLGYREKERLNDLTALFRKISAVSDNQAQELMELIYQSRLKIISQINLAAAIFVGIADAQRPIYQSDLPLLKQVANQSYLLTWDSYQDLERAFKYLFKNAPRRMVYELRDIQRSFDDNRTVRDLRRNR